MVAMNGRLCAFGGWWSDAVASSVESYDPSRNEWTVLKEQLIEEGHLASAIVL